MLSPRKRWGLSCSRMLRMPVPMMTLYHEGVKLMMPLSTKEVGRTLQGSIRVGSGLSASLGAKDLDTAVLCLRQKRLSEASVTRMLQSSCLLGFTGACTDKNTRANLSASLRRED